MSATLTQRWEKNALTRSLPFARVYSGYHNKPAIECFTDNSDLTYETGWRQTSRIDLGRVWLAKVLTGINALGTSVANWTTSQY